jgi:diadenylate cyclase
LSNFLDLFARLDWVNGLDILLVALVFYSLLLLIQGTQAVQLLRGLIILVLLAVLVTSIFQLTAFKWLVRNSIPALLVSIPVIFQPELRRALERLGRTSFLLAPLSQEKMVSQIITDICQASQRLSARRHGALIVLERETGLREYVDTGIRLNAELSSDLLLTIFFPNTALHDGAVIVRGNRIIAAACVLPLTEGPLPDRHLGIRHRAAVGITEQSDAIVIVVSEQTGIISITHSGRMIRRMDEKKLYAVLRAFYRPQFITGLPPWLRLDHYLRESRLFNLYSHLKNIIAIDKIRFK